MEDAELEGDWTELTVDGAVTRYFVKGEGEPLILLHGLSASVAWWRYNIPALSRHFRVHAIEFVRPEERWRPGFTLAQAAEGLMRWMAAAGLAEAHFIGHSMGGQIAARLAAHHPAHVRKLVLVNPATFFPRRISGADLLHLVRWAPHLPLSLVPTLSRDALHAGPFFLWRTARDLMTADLREEVAKITAPTLIIWGARDAILPVDLAKALQAAMSGSQLHIFPRAGHNPMWEIPTEFNDRVIAFLTP